MSGIASLGMLLMFIVLPLQRAPRSAPVLIRWLVIGTCVYYAAVLFIVDRLP